MNISVLFIADATYQLELYTKREATFDTRLNMHYHTNNGDVLCAFLCQDSCWFSLA